MRSRAERRRAIEIAWRALALAALGWAYVPLLRPAAPPVTRVDGASLGAALPELTRAPRPAAISVTFDAAPSSEARAWLVALQRSLDRVSWRASGTIPPLALEVAPRMDPAGGARASVASASVVPVALGDGAGALDTIGRGEIAATRRLPAFVPPLVARDGAQEARALLLDSLAPRRVLVIGGARWEAKFVLAALEEAGWRASARFRVAPGIDVAQGGAIVLDTARYATVIALDSSAASDAAAIAAFVRRGGGLILAGDAARAPRFAALAPGAVGPRVRPAALAFSDSSPRRALGFDAVTALRPDAIPIESRDGKVAVAARRAGIGRVMQVGYDESWRWRLAGGPHSVEAHRAWWGDLVAGVAYRPAIPTEARNGDAAPLAALVAALGPPRTTDPPLHTAVLPWWLFAVIVAALLAEWGSRRFRGAP